MTMEDKAKNKLMRKTKSELIEIIIKKDKTEIALRNDNDGTLKSLADAKQALKNVNDNLEQVVSDKELMENQINDLESAIVRWQSKANNLETCVSNYMENVEHLKNRCIILKRTAIVTAIIAIVFFASFIISLF